MLKVVVALQCDGKTFQRDEKGGSRRTMVAAESLDYGLIPVTRAFIVLLHEPKPLASVPPHLGEPKAIEVEVR